VTTFEVRALDQDQVRLANTVFRGALHMGPAPDDAWAAAAGTYEPERTLGAFEGTTLIGTTQSFGSDLTVPGGATIPVAAVTRVGVRADRTRRGVLTALMRAQLEELGEAGAVLHASEPVIYGRFGYGVTSRQQTVTVHAGARLRPDVPWDDRVRLIDFDEARTVLPEVYRRITTRTGMLSRSDAWWRFTLSGLSTGEKHWVVAVHTGPDGDDGFVVYQPISQQSFQNPDLGAVLDVPELQAGAPLAANSLWRFLTTIDLVAELRLWSRPIDEPLSRMVTDPRRVRSTVADEIWLRLTDVPAALAARTYGNADPVAVEVVDPLLPNNSDTYLVGDGVSRTGRAADVRMDVDTLAMIYLGATAPSVLAGIGRIQAADPAALHRLDHLFRTDSPPWCGTFF
jgi:predicted acetyltransferase